MTWSGTRGSRHYREPNAVHMRRGRRRSSTDSGARRGTDPRCPCALLGRPVGACRSTRPYVPWSAAPVALALLLVACGTPDLELLPPDAVLLAFGDSLTHGTGARAGESYPVVLERLTGHPVINEGVPGELSGAGSRRLAAVLDRHVPDLLLLCHGGNDLLKTRDAGHLEANLRRMIAVAHERGIPVLLIGVPEPGLPLGIADLYRDLAAELDLPLEDEALADILSDRALKSDTIHPNAAGYRLLAERVHDLLQRSGALP